MTQQIGELNPPYRLMLTPGPSSVDPRVYRALATPLVGHLDPWFKTCMDETQILLRQIFQTENRLTMPLSASGSGGIEASVLNALEEGDEAIVAVNGVFSERMFEIASRGSSKVIKVEAPYGLPVDAGEDQDDWARARRDFLGSADEDRCVPGGCGRMRSAFGGGYGGVVGGGAAACGSRADRYLF
jgi:alanine-glyoxylate transaminase/serine-glyoxylate transaminase/serine-pyruvate transaminase